MKPDPSQSACGQEWVKVATQEIRISYKEKCYHSEDGQTLEQRFKNFVAKGCTLGEIQSSTGKGPEQPD